MVSSAGFVYLGIRLCDDQHPDGRFFYLQEGIHTDVQEQVHLSELK